MQSVCYSLDIFLLSNQKIMPIFIVHLLCTWKYLAWLLDAPPKKL